VKRQGYRPPVAGAPVSTVHIKLASPPPAAAQLRRKFAVEVPQDCGRHDDFAIRNLKSGEIYEARASELMPRPTAALQMRIAIWAESIVAELLDELSKTAAAALREKGY
jgi:hypothetical protein